MYNIYHKTKENWKFTAVKGDVQKRTREQLLRALVISQTQFEQPRLNV